MSPLNDPSDSELEASSTTSNSNSSNQNAATNVIRGQIDEIYSGRSNTSAPHTTPVVAPIRQTLVNQPEPAKEDAQISPETSPTQAPAPSHGLRTAPLNTRSSESVNSGSNQQAEPSTQPKTMPQITEDQWKQYHSAWQKYYQMYYERYYIDHLPVSQSKQQLDDVAPDQSQDKPAPIGSRSSSLSQKDAMLELREKIRSKVGQSTENVKKSRHFTPAIAGLAVLLIFVFLQYNRAFLGAVAAYTSPGNINPQNIIVDPTTEVNVSLEPRMIIPKINVDAPVVYGIGPDHKSQMSAMEKGIAHFSIPGANATPGQVGNAVFAAHSSNDAFASGDYKFVFAQNEKLVNGDVIYMNFEGKRYTYAVTSTEVVMPNEVNRIQLNTDKPMLTLISCVPLGTAEKRLLVFAEQISPNPSGAPTAEANTSAPESSTIPGKPSPTLLERLFGQE